ncbi:PepSY domain-containing protein [Mucilaginibacter pallidiroseus]|uniref:PepSY domain-containing protein n=1 Tax=Mucilaginibacter pallidiroseus TaxID=2599295 RepID=A0A563UE15_9SPHI|nr:PepSY-associated TM helix domain-containing protein [Mucilaginibacter pallidiroseus]TWR29597.1 PepSY domain-containing protein [Mucilaginibacter pallidiroseus]
MMIWKNVKKVAAWLHLWVGLVTGIIVVIVSITGCIQVFDEELFDLVHKDLVEVKRTGPARPVSELLRIAQNAVGESQPINSFKIGGKEDSYVFSNFKVNDKKHLTLSYFSQFKYKNDVYINQYTGQVLGVIDSRYEFFNVVEQLHRQLLLIKPVGSVVVGGCILLFLLMMITGFLLWLPKNYRQFKQNITVKWSARYKRVNYDLHNSLGFYVLPIAIIIAITGLTWSFKWWEKGLYQAFGSSKKVELTRKAPIISTADTTGNNIDRIFDSMQANVFNNYRVIGFNLPDKKENVIMTYVYLKNRTDGWRNMSYYYYDARTGKLFDKMEHAKKPLGLKWRNSNKDIHTGRIYGLPTQLLAFFASFICASLPITGFLIWWGKRNKKPTKRRRRASVMSEHALN